MEFSQPHGLTETMAFNMSATPGNPPTASITARLHVGAGTERQPQRPLLRATSLPITLPLSLSTLLPRNTPGERTLGPSMRMPVELLGRRRWQASSR